MTLEKINELTKNCKICFSKENNNVSNIISLIMIEEPAFYIDSESNNIVELFLNSSLEIEYNIFNFSDLNEIELLKLLDNDSDLEPVDGGTISNEFDWDIEKFIKNSVFKTIL